MRSFLAMLLVCAPAVGHAQSRTRRAPRTLQAVRGSYVALGNDPEWTPRIRIADFVRPPIAEEPRLLGLGDPALENAVRAAEASLTSAPLDRQSPPRWALLLFAHGAAHHGRFEEAADAYRRSAERCAARDSECDGARSAASVLPLRRVQGQSNGASDLVRRVALARRELANGPRARAIARLRRIDRRASRSGERCALAEARFLLADELGRPVLGRSFPSFEGPETIALDDTATIMRLQAWSERTFAPALRSIVTRLQRAADAYRRAGVLGCVPVAIASLRAIGDLHRHLATELDALPPVEENPELSAIYCDCSEGPASSVRQSARAQYEQCQKIAIAQRWPSEDALRCEAALSEIDSASYPPFLELVSHAAWSVREVRPDPRSLDERVRTDALGLPPIARLGPRWRIDG